MAFSDKRAEREYAKEKAAKNEERMRELAGREEGRVDRESFGSNGARELGHGNMQPGNLNLRKE